MIDHWLRSGKRWSWVRRVWTSSAQELEWGSETSFQEAESETQMFHIVCKAITLNANCLSNNLKTNNCSDDKKLIKMLEQNLPVYFHSLSTCKLTDDRLFCGVVNQHFDVIEVFQEEKNGQENGKADCLATNSNQKSFLKWNRQN